MDLEGQPPLPGAVHQGFGRVDLDAVVAPRSGTQVYFLDDTVGLRTGRSDFHPLRVRSRTVPLRIAMAYSDFPGDTLVNNPNLILTDPQGRTFVGNGRSGAVLSPDTTNNVEVIHVNRPRTGNWTLKVIGSNVPEGPQPYALALSGRVD